MLSEFGNWLCSAKIVFAPRAYAARKADTISLDSMRRSNGIQSAVQTLRKPGNPFLFPLSPHAAKHGAIRPAARPWDRALRRASPVNNWPPPQPGPEL